MGDEVAIVFTLRREGVPEFWDALMGRVETIWNYSIGSGKTVVAVDLSKTPAPLVSVRSKAEWEPEGIECELRIVDCRYENGSYTITAELF